MVNLVFYQGFENGGGFAAVVSKTVLHAYVHCSYSLVHLVCYVLAICNCVIDTLSVDMVNTAAFPDCWPYVKRHVQARRCYTISSLQDRKGYLIFLLTQAN
jgi:hypothetical protein